MDIQSFLLANSDDDKAKFDSKIISTKYKIYGVKTILLENFAKNLTKTDFSFDKFKFESHEEILIAGMFLCYAKMELAGRLKFLERWLSFCDNWATCDMIAVRLRKVKGIDKNLTFFEELLLSNKTFTQRFGIVLLMGYIKMDKNFLTKILAVQNQDYYIKMAKAWAIAESAVSDYEYAFKIISSLDDKFLRNKSISKCRDSFRLTKQQKDELKKLRL